VLVKVSAERITSVRSLKLILVISFGVILQLGGAQTSSDWHKRYGQPEAERYAAHNGFVLTVSYSASGQTCKAMIESAKPQPRSTFESALNEIVPLAERGKELRSVNLSNLLESKQYERVTISLHPVSREDQEQIKSAVVFWHGLQCMEDEEQHK
jgi:hypothetical protein